MGINPTHYREVLAFLFVPSGGIEPLPRRACRLSRRCTVALVLTHRLQRNNPPSASPSSKGSDSINFPLPGRRVCKPHSISYEILLRRAPADVSRVQRCGSSSRIGDQSNRGGEVLAFLFVPSEGIEPSVSPNLGGRCWSFYKTLRADIPAPSSKQSSPLLRRLLRRVNRSHEPQSPGWGLRGQNFSPRPNSLIRHSFRDRRSCRGKVVIVSRQWRSQQVR